MKTNQNQNEEILKQFIVESALINPINKILSGLAGSEYRDCDIKWLDKKLEGFMKFACDTLGINGIMPSEMPHATFTILNDYNKKYFISKFTTLLGYFKTI